MVGEDNGVPLAPAEVLAASVEDVEANILAGCAGPGGGMGGGQAVSFAPFARVTREACEIIESRLSGFGRVAGGGVKVAEGAAVTVAEAVVERLRGHRGAACSTAVNRAWE